MPADCHGQLVSLCDHWLEPLRREFGPVTVHSGYRTVAYNRRVGGVAGSFHVYVAERQGVAADVTARRGTPRQWARLLEQLRAHGLGVYGDHVHVDNRAGHARW